MRFASVLGLFAFVATASADPTFTEIRSPNPNPPDKAQFGYAVAILDYNGDGIADIAAGAPGEQKVYVLFGGDFTRHITLEPGPSHETLNFGAALAVGELDGSAGDELVVGAANSTVGAMEKAGKIFVFGRSLSAPVLLQGDSPNANERLGNSVAVGDYDNDGRLEIAGGASGWPGEGYPGGKVYLFDVDFGEDVPVVAQRDFDNHQTVFNGNYGHDMSTADWNGDGIDDLLISAIGNTRTGGVLGQGQMVIFVGPVGVDGSGPAETVILEDNQFVEGEGGGRFGMSIDARKNLFAIGSPRKDVLGTLDAGMGFIYQDGEATRNFSPDDRIKNGILGYRARIGDFVGDNRLDVAFFSLPRGFYVYDAAKLVDPVFVPRPNQACAHWCVGAAVGQLFRGGKEELVLGGNDWEAPGLPGSANHGRIHIVTFEPPVTAVEGAKRFR